MLRFIRSQPSLFLLLVSTILTGVMAKPSFASLIVHLLNLGLLLVYRVETKNPANYMTSSVLLLVSLGLIAVMTPASTTTIVFQVINATLLLFVWGTSAHEAKTRAKASVSV